jgi:RNA polymerase sigma-70 factor (ECF subfamily)
MSDPLSDTSVKRIKASQTTRVGVDPDDLRQEVWLKILKNRPKVEHMKEEEQVAYSASVAHTVAIDQLRRMGRSKRGGGRVRPLRADPAADHTSPSGRATRNEELGRLMEAVASLRDDQRRAVQLRHIEGLSLSEAAERMGKSRAAVAGLLRRGLAEIRQVLVEGD